MDESGNSGENLLDARQPVFTLASVHLKPADAQRLATLLAGRAHEAHYTALRKRPSGRDRILNALADPALTRDTVYVSALHKPFMVPAKFVDLLIEPLVAAHGYDLYGDGMHKRIAEMLYARGPTACPRTWLDLMAAFVTFVWRGTPEAADVLAASLAEAGHEAGDDPVGDFLTLAPADPAVLLGWHGRSDEDPPADALDPQLTATVEHTITWGERLGPFLLVHDQSKVIGRWRQRLLALADPEIVATYAVTPSNRIPPLQLAGLAPVSSNDSPAVQVADVLAGATAELLRGMALRSPLTEWQRSLQEAQILRFTQQAVWPSHAPGSG